MQNIAKLQFNQHFHCDFNLNIGLFRKDINYFMFETVTIKTPGFSNLDLA